MKNKNKDSDSISCQAVAISLSNIGSLLSLWAWEAKAASRIEPHIDGVAALTGVGCLLELEGQYRGLSRLNGAISQGSFPAGTEACRSRSQVR